MLILLIILLLVLGGGGGYYGHSRWGYGGGAGVGIGTILLVLLLVYMLGIIHKTWRHYCLRNDRSLADRATPGTDAPACQVGVGHARPLQRMRKYL